MSLWSAHFTKYCSDYQINKNEMEGSSGTFGGKERCIQGFGGENWVKETNWKTVAEVGESC
jgi:hypothetical protein